MLGNSKHLSGAPGFDPCFQDLFYLISKCRFILFNRVGQRDLHGLFWRARGPLAGICGQGGEQDVCLLAVSSSLLLSLSWGQRMGLGAWLSTLVAERLLFSYTPLDIKTVMVWLCFSCSSPAASSGAAIS